MNTPKYVFNKSEIENCYNAIKEKLHNITICYALKANSEIAVLQILKEINADFEVASSEEFDKLLSINVDPNKIICGLPVKPKNMIDHLYSNGCRYFVFDMPEELNKLLIYAPNSKKILRLNINDLIPSSIEFGMPIKEIIYCLNDGRNFAKNIDGISFHISNNIDIDNCQKVIDRVEYLLKMLPGKKMVLNIGGGYRIYASDDFFLKLNNRLQDLTNNFNLKLVAEPGNTVVNSAGSVFTKVIGVRKRDNNVYDIYIDAGKPTGIKTDEKRIPSFIRLVQDKPVCEERQYRFVDITCMHKPHFSIKLSSIVEDGDIFEFGDMGAYTVCLSSNFHAWKPPVVEIV